MLHHTAAPTRAAVDAFHADAPRGHRIEAVINKSPVL